MVAAERFGLRDPGDSEDGDHGIEGSALVMLLRDIVLCGWSRSTVPFESTQRVSVCSHNQSIDSGEWD